MVRAGSAVFGGALAVSLAPMLQRRAASGELPGALPAAGLSPNGPILQFGLVVLFAFLFAIAGTFAARRLAGVRWATIGYVAATLSAPLPLMVYGNVRHVALHGLVAVAVLFLRDLRPRFTFDDVVLIPVLLSCDFSFLDIGFGRTPIAAFERAAIAVLALRLIAGVMTAAPRPALAFFAAPLALLFQLQWLPSDIAGFAAVVWIVCSALLGAVWSTGRRPGTFARVLAFAVYPIALSAYPLALVGVHSVPHVDFFEDAHDLVPASEMLRGERPYTDVLPTHGFLSDGGLDFLFMRFGAADIGQVLAARRVVAVAGVAAIYFVALGATGSGAAGCLAVLLGFALFPASTLWWRMTPALLGVAAFAAAVRLRSEAWIGAAGAALGLALLTSVDFAAYTAVLAVIVVLRWPRRLRAAAAAGAGLGIVLVPALAAFAAGRFFVDFFRGTLDIVRSGRVFVGGAFPIPECLRSPGAMIWQLPSAHCLSAVLWIVATVVTAAALARSPLRMRRSDSVWMVGVWMAVAGVAWAERQHAYYEFALSAFVISALFLFRRHRATVAALAVALALLARPFAHVFDVATAMRRDSGVATADALTVPEIPRARDALFPPQTAAGLRVMQRYIATNLGPRETFFDFSNAGLLYYLFDRDCPIRQVAVPFYESADAQRQVIAALQRNAHVRAALIDFPPSLSAIDGVPNRARVPLVWQYVQQNFLPAADEAGVVIWKRRGSSDGVESADR